MSQNFTPSGVVVVIPSYNEEKHIFEVVRKAKKYVDHVIVIDDGSTDETANKAKFAGAQVISHRFNKGKGAALNTAFNFLLNSDVKVVVALDGDGQHDANEILNLIKPIIDSKADMVVGSRFISNSYSIPAYRRLGQTILNVATSWGSRIKLTDSQSGYRAFSYDAIKVMRFMETGLSVESEMQFIASMYNLRVVEVPISIKYFGPLKRNPIKHGFTVFCRVLRLTVYFQFKRYKAFFLSILRRVVSVKQ